MILYPFSAWLPRPERVTDPADFFLHTKEDFRRYADDGCFRPLGSPALFLYQIDRQGRTHRGLIGTLDLSAVDSGRICPHEQTFPSQVHRQLELLRERRAAVKPVLLTYPPRPALAALLPRLAAGEPTLDMSTGTADERHRLWIIDSPHDLQDIFHQEVQHLVIADGHHRLQASYALFKGEARPVPYDRLLCALFSTDQLDIHNYNRLIRLDNSESTAELLQRLSPYTHASPLPGPAMPRSEHELVLYYDQQWFRLRWHPRLLERRTDNLADQLDANLLTDYLIHEALGIDDVRMSDRVDYIEGPRGPEGLRRLVDAAHPALGLILRPIDPTVFIELSETGCLLPPKSTWFEPRMLNGLIVQPI